MAVKPQTNKPFQKGKLALLFDFDGTLTEPRKKIKPEMAELMKKLHDNPNIDLFLVGGSDLPKIKEQLGDSIKDFKISFAENGLIYEDDKGEVHTNDSIKNYLGKDKLKELVNFCLKYIADLDIPAKTGTFIELRTGIMNVSPVGRNCNQDERKEFSEYDEKNHVLEKFKDVLVEKFSDKMKLEFSVAGQISFDVYPIGWGKGYCLKFIKGYENIVYFADRVDPGQNDYEVMTGDLITKGVTVQNTDDALQKISKIADEFNALNK